MFCILHVFFPMHIEYIMHDLLVKKLKFLQVGKNFPLFLYLIFRKHFIDNFLFLLFWLSFAILILYTVLMVFFWYSNCFILLRFKRKTPVSLLIHFQMFKNIHWFMYIYSNLNLLLLYFYLHDF